MNQDEINKKLVETIERLNNAVSLLDKRVTRLEKDRYGV